MIAGIRTSRRNEYGKRRGTTPDRVNASERRDRIERLLRLAHHLPRADRRLLEMYYAQGSTCQAIAELYRMPATQVRRRIRRLRQRVQHPMFRYLIVNGGLLPRRTRRVAGQVVFHGQSLRRTARRLGLSLHAVRRHMLKARIMAGDLMWEG